VSAADADGGGLAGASGGEGSVFVKKADAAGRHVAVVAEVQAEVTTAMEVTAQAHRVLDNRQSTSHH